MKTCKKCNIKKQEEKFSKSEYKISNGRCKDCVKQYYINNKDRFKKQNKERYLKNKNSRLAKAKEYYKENKNKILQKRSKYINDNKDIIKLRDKVYYEANKQNILEKIKNYNIMNKNKIQKKKNVYKKNKRMTDPKFAMRESISSSIYYMLNGDKSKQSILNYVPWTLDELILHIESKFENWMSWDNRGIYSKATWDDNDPSTWKWHLDHIVPHSSFQYSSMEDDEFKKCWSLDNLRPYSAKQNVIDGARNV